MPKFNSFSDMASYLGVKPKKRETKEKSYKCPRCGSILEHIGNSNVFLCTKQVPKKNKDGATEMKECGFRKLIPVERAEGKLI